jgi:hypothetical protein
MVIFTGEIQEVELWIERRSKKRSMKIIEIQILQSKHKDELRPTE